VEIRIYNRRLWSSILTGYLWLSSVSLNKFVDSSLKQVKATYFQIMFSHFSIIVLPHWPCLWKAPLSKCEKVQYNALGTVNLLLDSHSAVTSFRVVVFMDIVHSPIVYLKHNVSETGFCLHLQMKSTQLNTIESPFRPPDTNINCTYWPTSIVSIGTFMQV
jgi:hypothetical protein